MARQIKETPILKGKDARRFFDKMRSSSEFVFPKLEIRKMQEDYAKISDMITDKNAVRI